MAILYFFLIEISDDSYERVDTDLCTCIKASLNNVPNVISWINIKCITYTYT